MPGQEKELKAVALALAEIGITADVKESVRPDLLNTRESLIAELHKLGQSRDIDGILQAERGILAGERTYLAEEPETIKSLDTAIEQIDAAIEMLAIVRDPDQYRVIDKSLSISKNRVGRERLPRDQARQFFQAHPTRLRNLIKARIDESYVPVIRVRLLNITTMEPVYKELQKEALGPERLQQLLQHKGPDLGL